MGLSLGKTNFTPDSRDWRWVDFRASLKAAGLLPSVSAIFGHGNTYADWKMLGNGPDPTAPGRAAEGAGDCVWAAAEHETMEALTNAGQGRDQVATLFDGSTAITDYAAATGYDPTTGSGDNGTEIRSALLYRQKTGIVNKTGVRHKIGPFVSIEPGNLQHLLEALFFFEGLPIGIELQEAQMSQFNQAEARGTTPIWSYVKNSPIIGGHCVPEVGHPASGELAGISWAKKVILTEGFLAHQCDEVWGYLTPERISRLTGKTYEGASEAQLEETLHIIGSS